MSDIPKDPMMEPGPGAAQDPRPDVPPVATAEPARDPAQSSGRWQHALQRITRQPWTVAAVVLVAVLGWQWYASHSQLSALREELATRLRDSDADSRDARLVARQAQEAVRDAQTKLAQLDAKLAESQSQQVALEALYQELARNRDEWALSEIEQILTTASQQLQLAGNVQGALVALQTADARLARSDRPQFIPLRKTLARDIDRLKTTPTLDVAGMTLRIDQMINSIDSLPLSAEGRAAEDRAADKRAAADPAQGFWTRLGSEVWSELRSLIRVQVMDGAEPGLLSPGQNFFLRENLKLRLLNARLALLSRDESTFREDIRTASAWVARWFDARSKSTQTLQATLKQMSSTAVQIEVPTIGESLNAVRNYKVVRDKAR
jgi:uroporphyrin-3 C-methyltransferase